MVDALVIRNARAIATLAGGMRRGAAQNDAAVLAREDGTLALAIVDGRIDAVERLRPAEDADLAPTVVLHPDASDRATVLEVRAADRQGVVYLACAAFARLGLTVASAHVDTLGPQAVDVFYVQEADGGVLDEIRSADAAAAVSAALVGAG